MGQILIGIDEAGMGTLAGPMTAAVVVIEEDHVPAGVRDSKKLGEEQREELAALIMDEALFYRVVVRTPEEIDERGLSACWESAVRELIASISVIKLSKRHEAILDGNRTVGVAHVRPVVKADDKFPAVSAASILAKYTQCCWMDDYHLEYPGYGFDRHRGYGTSVHKRRLEELGPCPAHRKSYKPVKEALRSQRCGSSQRSE